MAVLLDYPGNSTVEFGKRGNPIAPCAPWYDLLWLEPALSILSSLSPRCPSPRTSMTPVRALPVFSSSRVTLLARSQ